MIITKAYKVEIKPNNKQKTLLNKTFGVARFTYNWGLARRIELYKTEKKSTTAYTQSKELNAIKKEQFPWMYEVSSNSPKNSLIDLEDAFNRFFKSCKSSKKVGFPKFKCKNKSKESFRFWKKRFIITEAYIGIPNIGKVRLKNKGYIPIENVKYNSATVSKKAGRYFVSVQCTIEIPDITKNKETILGVDLGIKTLLVCSDGKKYDNPKNTYKYEKKLAHAQKNLSRTKKGSKNFNKTKLKVQKLHVRIANSRLDSIHKATTAVVKTKPRYIVLEDLNVKGMVQNHCLAKAISDCEWGEIKEQFGYKSIWYGSEILGVPRFFPSSKMCRMCGQIKENLTLKDRIFVCDGCGHTEDRDDQASINMENYGLSTLGSRGIKACGESVRLLEKSDLGAISKNQEENSKSDRDKDSGLI